MGFSQRMAKVSATYTYYAPETMSVEEAKRVALDRAKIQAIADEFGTIVTQSNSTIISNKNGQSDTHFFSLGGSDVKGEWIETIGEPSIDVNYTNNTLVVRVDIKGKAREIIKRAIPLIAKVSRGRGINDTETDCFVDGDNIFLQFQTPIDGYLLVYLIDYSAEQTYCLLPYASSSAPSYEVKNDIKYIFFSEDQHKGSSEIDEYTLICTSEPVEHNEIVILFSPNRIIKNNTNRISNNVPRHMSLLDFTKWLAELKKSNQDIYTIHKPITIKQKNS